MLVIDNEYKSPAKRGIFLKTKPKSEEGFFAFTVYIGFVTSASHPRSSSESSGESVLQTHA